MHKNENKNYTKQTTELPGVYKNGVDPLVIQLDWSVSTLTDKVIGE